MASKEEKLRDPLADLDDIQGVSGGAVVRRDGLLIVSNLPQDIDADQLAAMTASTVGSGETASQTLEIGSVEQVTVEAENGKLISTGAGTEAILTLLTNPDVNMGLVLVEMKKAVKKIKRVL